MHFRLWRKWEKYLSLVEFAYNNSYQVSIHMTPFEALNGRRCRSPVGRFEAEEAKLLVPNLVQDALERVQVIKQRLVAAQSRQKTYVDVSSGKYPRRVG